MHISGSTAARFASSVSGLLAAGLLAGCSGGDHGTAPALASASAGSLTITGGYVPEPASPDVASAYLTITNTGDTSDTLEKATSDATSMVMPMDEHDSGGVGSMTDLTDVSIPAHGSMQFTPDHAHLMLEQPTTLKAGNHVSMTLTFAHAGAVTLRLPVLPLGQAPTSVPARMTMAPAGGSGPAPGTAPDGMSGMSMPSS